MRSFGTHFYYRCYFFLNVTLCHIFITIHIRCHIIFHFQNHKSNFHDVKSLCTHAWNFHSIQIFSAERLCEIGVENSPANSVAPLFKRMSLRFFRQGISYPPPSPPRGSLRRALALPQSRNPPLIKTRHVSASMAGASSQVTMSFDTDTNEERRRRLEHTQRMQSTSSITEEKVFHSFLTALVFIAMHGLKSSFQLSSFKSSFMGCKTKQLRLRFHFHI